MRTPPAIAFRNASSSWFDHPAVQAWVHAEQREVIPLLTSQIGVRGLYLRPSAGYPIDLSGNMLQSVTRMHRAGVAFDGELRCSDNQFPIASDSLSLAYALHVLESSPCRGELLSELGRVLQPEGLLVALVFSRVSPFRLRWRGATLAACDAVGVLREVQSAGLSVERFSPVGACWPLAAATADAQPVAVPTLRWFDRLLGGWRTSWVVVARKRRVGMTPVGRVGAVRMQPRAWPT